MDNLSIEHRPIDSMVPYARNARTHSDAQVAQIAASIKEFGWTTPILVDEHNGIVAGHGRVLAARKLGMDSVPVIQLKNLTPTQIRAYILADNKLTLNGGWDDDLLKLELLDLKSADFDLNLIGFDSNELDELMFEAPGEDKDADSVPEAPEIPITKPGDVWLLGTYFECEKCGKRYDYDKGVTMKECPCG